MAAPDISACVCAGFAGFKKDPWARMVATLLVVLGGAIIVSIGYLLCVLPGLLLTAIVLTAAYLVATGEKDGSDHMAKQLTDSGTVSA